MKRRTVLLGVLLLLVLAGCHGPLHELPPIDRAALLAAKAEARFSDPPPPPVHLSERQARHRLAVAVRRVRAVGEEVCRELGVGICTWRFDYGRARTLNAGAYADGRIVLNHGLAERAANEEEISLVVAHEMGHLVANHGAPLEAWYRLVWEVGWRAGYVVDRLAALAGRQTRGTAYGTLYGKWLGQLVGARRREAEADYLAVLIAYRAGIDLDRARGLEVREARRARRLQSSLLDSHPVGAERLAAFDRAVAEVRATDGRLPSRVQP